MRCSVLSVLFLSAVVTAGAPAQTWTAEQQKLIDFGDACWTSWATEDWDAYVRACPADASLRYWDMSQSIPALGHKSWKRWNEAIWPRMKAIHYEIRPIVVQIQGDLGLYYFYATYSNEFAGGQITTANHHELAVFQRRAGNWVLVGGATMSFPVQ